MKAIKLFFYKIITITFLFIINIPYPNLYGAQSTQLIVIRDMEIEAFISKLISPIFKAAGIDSKSIKIYIVNNPTPNAFVYGGQNIFIHTGLITFADTYEEIAGVLAHELGHITAGHLSRGEIAAQNANIIMFAGMAALLLLAPLASRGSEDFSDVVGFLALGSQQFGLASFLSYSRGEETQADQIGVEYINNTNYSLEGFANFMKKLSRQEDTALYSNPAYSWYSTHPLTSNRIKFISSQISKKIQLDSTLTTEFNLVKTKIIAYNLNTFDTLYNYKNSSLSDSYGIALANYKNYNFKAAALQMETLISKNNSYIYFYDTLGDIYFDNKEYEKAITNYKKVLENYSDDIINFKLAKSYFALNDNINSLKKINVSIQINNNNPAAWHLKSLILGKEDKLGEANLALAEKYLILSDYKRATFFAQKALSLLPKGSKEWMDSNEILNIINDQKRK